MYRQLKNRSFPTSAAQLQELPSPFLEPYYWPEKPAFSFDGWIVRSHWSFPIAALSSFNLVFQGNNHTVQQPSIRHVISPVSSREVRRLLKDLDPSKAARRSDGWNSTCGSQNGGEIAFPLLLILFNASLTTGVLISYITRWIQNWPPSPAPQAREIQLKPRKHRTIAESRWHAFCWRFWRKSCIVRYTNIWNHPWPCPSQFGFRQSHSCSDLLLSVVDNWLSARDSGKVMHSGRLPLLVWSFWQCGSSLTFYSSFKNVEFWDSFELDKKFPWRQETKKV